MIYWWEEKRKAEGQNDPGFIRQSFTMNLLLLGRTLNPMGDTKMKKKRKENMAPSRQEAYCLVGKKEVHLYMHTKGDTLEEVARSC